MPNPENQELMVYIDQLIEATRMGTMQWKGVNPTTYLWEKLEQRAGARISLQRVERNVARRVSSGAIQTVSAVNYIFQVFEVNGPQSIQRLSVDSADDPELTQKLNDLFVVIKSGVSRIGLDFLKDILPHH
jgi:hypothetical protein